MAWRGHEQLTPAAIRHRPANVCRHHLNQTKGAPYLFSEPESGQVSVDLACYSCCRVIADDDSIDQVMEEAFVALSPKQSPNLFHIDSQLDRNQQQILRCV